MNKPLETLLGIVGLIVIPPAIGSFVFFKEDVTISVQHCETAQGRRGMEADNVYTTDGEKLEIAPAWLGGPKRDVAWELLCPKGRARVIIRGPQLEALPFLHRMIFDVRA
ncbi:MAG: hypothetical protein ACR2RA_23115 [Geminicoccaceae bacterium]